MVVHAVVLVSEVSVETVGWAVIALCFATGWLASAYAHDLKGKFIKQTGQIGKFYEWKEKRKDARKESSIL